MDPCAVVVMDVEGTTSAARYVYDVLFPYARAGMRDWVTQHGDDPATRQALQDAARDAGIDEADTEAVIAQLLAWIDADVKAAPLKTLQGLIWQEGYDRGDLTSHMFSDVEPSLRAWRSHGLRLAIYSSGSVTAQKALFAHAPSGNLDELIDANFDITTAGPKREASSYATISAALGVPPGQLLFLSDIQAEIDAARQAGWQAVGLRRDGEAQADVHGDAVVTSFAELEVEPAT